MDPVVAVRRYGGIARTRELRSAGCSPHALARAIHLGSLVRIRIGWFALPTVPEFVLRAHRVGGRPACASIASERGLWMLHSPVLHIEAAPTDSRFRAQLDPQRAIGICDRSDVVVHWVGTAPRERLGQPLAVALAQMVTCVDELDAICAIDSALAGELCTSEQIGRHLSGRSHAVLDRCDGRAESGVESIFRVRALSEGLVFRIQVPFSGSRVDFLFGDRLIVEVDGAEHHAGAETFKRDRERDAWHAALGYLVMRFTYEQVVHRWTEVSSVLRLLIQRREHLDSRSRIRRFV